MTTFPSPSSVNGIGKENISFFSRKFVSDSIKYAVFIISFAEYISASFSYLPAWKKFFGLHRIFHDRSFDALFDLSKRCLTSSRNYRVNEAKGLLRLSLQMTFIVFRATWESLSRRKQSDSRLFLRFKQILLLYSTTALHVVSTGINWFLCPSETRLEIRTSKETSPLLLLFIFDFRSLHRLYTYRGPRKALFSRSSLKAR